MKIAGFLKKILRTKKNYHNRHRTKMIDLAFDFCQNAKVSGDYFEFGVFEGMTFQYAYQAAQDRGLREMKFYAFDSFEGFSEPKGSDRTGAVVKGARFCSEEKFKNNLRGHKVDLSKVKIFPGWFEKTLAAEEGVKNARSLEGRKAAFIWFDADLFEPTVLALDFATPFMVDGTVVAFDNWFLFKGNPARGEIKAFLDWQKKHPEFTVAEFSRFGWHGRAFIINTVLADSAKK